MSQSNPQGTGSGQPRVIIALAKATGVDPERRQVLARAPDRGEIALPVRLPRPGHGGRAERLWSRRVRVARAGAEVARRCRAIRSKLLRAYETAETEEDYSKHRDLLTMVLVGAGPTGAELDGAIAHIVKVALRSNFRRVEFRQRMGLDGRTPLRQEPELTHGRRCRVPPWRCGCVPS